MSRTLIPVLLFILAFTASVAAGDEHPKKVRELASGLAQQLYSDSTQQAAFVSAYLAGFKSGLVSPSGTATMGTGKPEDPSSGGFSAGRNEAISNAANLGITLADYGYVRTNVTGYVFFAFEQSEFRPLESTQVWWIAFNQDLGRAYSSLVDKNKIPRTDMTAVRASLAGILSPERTWGYGHLGQYRRELVVEKVIEIKADK